MSQWDFVAAAYAIAIVATAALILVSAVAMRRAEARVEEDARL
jgi:hypothetical protein